DRAQRGDPVRRRLDYLDHLGVPVGAPVGGDPRPHPFARQRVADEHHPAFVMGHTAAAVGGGASDQCELPASGFAVQSKIPRRASPGAACGCSVLSRSDEDNSQGTEVTITLGMNSNRPLSRSALWLCSSCSHQWPTTYSGMKTVTTVRGDSLLT